MGLTKSSYLRGMGDQQINSRKCTPTTVERGFIGFSGVDGMVARLWRVHFVAGVIAFYSMLKNLINNLFSGHFGFFGSD